ncbi:hypothetical protein PPNK14_39490 [Pectobacterium parmentieri]
MFILPGVKGTDIGSKFSNFVLLWLYRRVVINTLVGVYDSTLTLRLSTNSGEIKAC